MIRLLFLGFSLLLVPGYLFSQSLTIDSVGTASYAEEITQRGSQDELFEKGKQWVERTFKSAEEVILQEDSGGGLIQLEGVAFLSILDENSTSSKDVPMHFLLSLHFGDGEYGYRFSEIYIDNEETAGNGINMETILKERESGKTDNYRQYKGKAEGVFTGISDLLKQAMRQP